MSRLYSRVNNTIIPAEEAAIHLGDMAIQRGYGIFDFFKIIGNKAIFLDEHLTRFYASANAMRLPISYTREELKTIIRELIEKNKLPQSGMRMTLTGGYAEDGYSIHQPNLLLVQQPLKLADVLQPGIKLVTYEHQRQLPQVKSIDYLMAVWLQPYIQKQEASDVLYHQQGIITECPRANFFIVNQKDQLITPNANILNGITRKKVLELASSFMEVKEAPVTITDIREAKEAFITSTTKHVLPVTEVDGSPIGNGEPGAVTRRLFEAITNLVFTSEP